MTLTRTFDVSGKPIWRFEDGRPVHNSTPLRCGCPDTGGRGDGRVSSVQVCMRCYTCRAHCTCWRPKA